MCIFHIFSLIYLTNEPGNTNVKNIINRTQKIENEIKRKEQELNNFELSIKDNNFEIILDKIHKHILDIYSITRNSTQKNNDKIISIIVLLKKLIILINFFNNKRINKNITELNERINYLNSEFDKLKINLIKLYNNKFNKLEIPKILIYKIWRID